MCRGEKFCSEFGEIDTWSTRSPLPPPAWVASDIYVLSEAAFLAVKGESSEAAEMLIELRNDEAREWFVEHAQVSANHRRRILMRPRGKGVSVNRVRTPLRLRRIVWERDHFTCRYCDLPTISPDKIKVLRTLLGYDALPWGYTNASRHGTLLLARTEYDHVVPVSLGGGDTEDNLVTSCPACNYGKDRWSIEELGLDDPRLRPIAPTEWNGLAELVA